jgi:tripeptidyl-peptidase I
MDSTDHSLTYLQGLEDNTKEVVCQSNRGKAITSGGGFSNYYTQPFWQESAISNYFTSVAAAGQIPQAGYHAAGRGYPDVSLAGSMYLVYLGDKMVVESGTSASTPAIAGFFSTINAARFAIGKGALGWINPALYANSDAFVNDITSGDNLCAADGSCCPQGFYATDGWDPATGLGSVNFGKMQSVLVALGNPVNGALIPPTMAPSSVPRQGKQHSHCYLIS